MSIFSTKYQTTVGTSITRVIPDDILPNAPKTALIKALMSNGDIVENLLTEISGSLGNRVERMYEYAKDNYSIGLPTAYAKNSKPARQAVEDLLTAEEGKPVTIEYIHLGTPNLLHIGWMRLKALNGYNEATNEINSVPGVPTGQKVYLDDMRVVYEWAEPGFLTSHSMEQWGIAPNSGYTPERPAVSANMQKVVKFTSPILDTSIEKEEVRVYYVWQNPNDEYNDANGFRVKPITRGFFNLDVTTGMEDDGTYYHVKYSVMNGTVKETKYVIYLAGSGVYPELDATVEFPPQQGEYFPFTYFRFMKIPLSTLPDSPQYKTTKKMLKYLKMNYDEVEEKIHENPDIADVEQAMMMFAIPANTDNQLELRYLCKHFDEMYYTQDDPVPNEYLKILKDNMNYAGSPVKDVQYIMDNWFKFALAHGGIHKRTIGGRIADTGKYTKEYKTVPEVLKYSVDTESGIPMEQTATYWISRHIYRHQVSDAAYTEWEVVALKNIYFIYGEHIDGGNDEEDILLIPVDRSLVADWTTPEKEELYARSMHFVFNSRVVTEVKWYQSSWFSALMSAVQVVLVVVGFGSSEILKGIVAAAGIGAVTVVINLIVMGLVELAILNYAITAFVEAVGMELAFLTAILAAFTGYLAQSGLTNFTLPYANQLVQIGSSLLEGVNSTLKDALADIQYETDLFGIQASIQEQEVARANALLETNRTLSPFTIFGETPTQYYDRTVHSGNIGTTIYNSITSYVDTALTLPKLHDTLGETLNGSFSI